MKKIYYAILMTYCLFGNLIFSEPVQLDSSFGSSHNGTVITSIGDEAIANAVILQPDGKIVLIGEGHDAGQYVFVARYLSGGTLDSSFGTSGIVKTTFRDGLLGKNALLLQDGKILVTGAFVDKNGPQFASVRYLSDGSLDTTWGDGGINWCAVYGVIESIADAPNDKMVCGGVTAMNQKMIGAGCRRFYNGTLDPTFGPGQGSTATIVGLSTQIHEVVAQPDGMTVMAGVANDDGNKFLCVRYTDAGILDDSFGSGGIVTTVFPGTSYAHAYTVGLQTDGKILVAGESDHQCSLVRYNIDGSVDSDFGINGFVRITLGTASIINALVIQADGKIVCVGQSDNDIVVLRFNVNGSPDTTFGVNGIITTGIGSDGQAQDVVVQPDGNIVIGGGANGKFVIARYRASNANFIVPESPANGSTITLNTFSMTGSSSQAGFQLRLKLDGTTIATSITDSVGNWNAGISPIVANGQHTLVAELLTSDGDVLCSASSTFIVNSASDTISIAQPLAGAVINTNKPLVAGESSRSSALVLITLDETWWASTTTDIIGKWQVILAAIPNGLHELKAVLLVNSLPVAQASRSFTASQYLCDNLRVLGGIFTTGNPPVVNAGSGSSCPPTCDFTVQKIDHNKFNITYGFPFSYPPIITSSAEKIRSTQDGFVTIVEGGTVGYVILELHGRASQIHFSAGSCRS